MPITRTKKQPLSLYRGRSHTTISVKYINWEQSIAQITDNYRWNDVRWTTMDCGFVQHSLFFKRFFFNGTFSYLDSL